MLANSRGGILAKLITRCQGFHDVLPRHFFRSLVRCKIQVAATELISIPANDYRTLGRFPTIQRDSLATSTPMCPLVSLRKRDRRSAVNRG